MENRICLKVLEQSEKLIVTKEGSFNAFFKQYKKDADGGCIIISGVLLNYPNKENVFFVGLIYDEEKEKSFISIEL